MFHPVSSCSASPSAGRSPLAAKPLDSTAVSDLKGGIADVIFTLSRSAQWTEATGLRDQIYLLASAHCDLTVQRFLAIKEIATILCVGTNQVRRQLKELNIRKGDPAVGDGQPEFLSPIGRLTQENARLKAEVASLKTKVQRLNESRDDAQVGCFYLQERILHLEAECSSKDGMIQSLTRDLAVLSDESALYAGSEFVRIAPEFPGCPVFWPNLRRHFLAWSDLFLHSFAYWHHNRLKQIQYPQNLHSLYALIRLQSKRCAVFLHDLLGFPSLRTLDRFVAEKAGQLNITASLFDGSLESLAIIRNVLSAVESPPRVCIGFDATAIKPYLRLELGGILHGLRQASQIIRGADVESFLGKSNPIQDLLTRYSDELATSEFVVMALGLSPMCPSVPVAIFSSNSGALNHEKYEQIEAIARGMKTVGFDCRGFAHDGDRFLLHPAHKFLERALIEFHSHLGSPFDFAAFMEDTEDAHFFDMLHMLKNDRMQKIQREGVLFPCLGSVAIAPQAYRSLHSIPIGAFNESPSVKMDDHLAERFFSPHALVECASIPQLFVAMFPCCALYHVVKYPLISRPRRFDLLMLLFGYLLYYTASNVPNPESHLQIWGQFSSRYHRLTQREVLFRTEFIEKMLITCFSMMRELVKGESLDMGSLGSHKNEHFFGCVKSKLRNFETDSAFNQCARKMMMARLLCDELGISVSLTKRMNDSGVKLDAAAESHQDTDLGASLATARLFFTIALGSDAIPDLAPGREPIVRSIDELLDRYGFREASEVRRPSLSTVSECVSSWRNASQFRNFHEASQIAATFTEPDQGEE